MGHQVVVHEAEHGRFRRLRATNVVARKAIVFAAAVAMASCGGGASRQSSVLDAVNRDFGGVAVDWAALHGPGAELADGVVVPMGAALVGTRFPDPYPDGSTGENRGWSATLLVDGKPFDVWDQMVQDVGMNDGALAVTACTGFRAPSASKEGGDSPTREAGSTALGGDQWAECSADNGRWSLSMTTGVIWNCQARPVRSAAAEVPCGWLPQRHLYVSWRPTKQVGQTTPNVRTKTSDVGPELGTKERGRPVLEVVPDMISWLPQAGEPIDAGLDLHLAMGALVDGGARSMVAPARYSESCGLASILASPLAPEDALDSVRVADGQARSAVRHGTDREGRAWAWTALGAGGGYHLEVTAVARHKEPAGGNMNGSWVRVTDCGGN